MCGIIAYLGQKPAAPILLAGLARLEYRGYDSAGIALVHDGKMTVVKRVGKVATLKGCSLELPGTFGLGHTRWATHGEPTEANAHPHGPADESFTIAHNGIIENYAPIKEGLIAEGYKFTSETDTEVLALHIHHVIQQKKLPIVEGVIEALKTVKGAYGIVLLSKTEPRTLVCARMGSPLILGVGENEFFAASDAAAFLEHTRRAVYMNEGDIAVITDKGYTVHDINGKLIEHPVAELEGSLQEIEKAGYPHYMIKEIMSQPESLANCLRGRLGEHSVSLAGLRNRITGQKPPIDPFPERKISEEDDEESAISKMRRAKRIIICACGTSWHAALVGRSLIESLARIITQVEYASEFRYKEPLLDAESDVVIVISQSGETADTLAAVREAKSRGVLCIGICNTVGSSIGRETDAGVYLHAGPEIGVASTKAFTAQVAVLTMLAVALGQGKTLSVDRTHSILQGLRGIPALVAQVLRETYEQMVQIAKEYRYAHHFIFLGRGINYPVALEGALKMKEISYIHAEGYPAAEMKHGPIALIDRLMPVVVIAVRDSIYEKVKSNICEVKARQGSVIAITDTDNQELDSIADHVIRVPPCEECLQPLLTTIPLQLLSYQIATMRGCNVDQPRNLAKSVTVE